MSEFLAALRIQRGDDHRYYHHNRINQTLHFVSAIGFLIAYALLFSDPILASLIGWLWSMVTRQAGHFIFEPTDYDKVNNASQEYKEAIKVGYNLNRKIVLLSLWGAVPLALLASPTLWGLLPANIVEQGFLRSTGALWLVIGAGALVFRMIQLLILKDAMTSLVWFAKIITDPINDIRTYWRAPIRLLQGELYDPHHGEQHEQAA